MQKIFYIAYKKLMKRTKRPGGPLMGRPRKRQRTTGSFGKPKVSRNLTVPALALKLFERKKFQTGDTEQGINTLAGYYATTKAMTLTQGDTYATLEGHIIRGSGIKFDFWLKSNATTTTVVRYIIVKIKNGIADASAFQAGTGVLEDNTGNIDVTTASATQKMTGRINRDKYTVLIDRKLKLGSTSSTDGTDVAIRKHWLPMGGQPFVYNGSNVQPERNLYAMACWCALANSDESLGETVEITNVSNFYYVDP